MGKLKPTVSIKRVTDADLDSIWESGKRGLLVDADNTLIPFGTLSLPEGYRDWLDRALAKGFRIVVFTNNFRRRAGMIGGLLGLPVVYGWVKPWPWGMARAMRALGLPKEQVILFGDQLFTDILGANFEGIDSVLVEPLAEKDSLWTKLMRRLEKLTGRGR